ncbi:hypothetical protein AZE42_08316 [Rhizopogon vesiculosus]|uniref:Uncharacterized protein n=1 Tax=Rhizopogon vesiculosus TaxID=180088 RepID=A0A1J8R158_9AGAM|nr:hypothetical protein AZE42_08316 [Rhizopogon vesiculosus]
MFLSDKRHTFGDYVASDEAGRRPHALLFCLSWFQKKEKKFVPQPQVYDVDLINAEREEDPLDVPIPAVKPRSDVDEQDR